MIWIKRAVFLDRDGVVNEEISFLHRADDLRLIPRSDEAIALLNKENVDVILVTNQPAIAKGLCTEVDLAVIHDRLSQMLAEKGAHIDAIYYCPHHPRKGFGEYRKICDCRKPSPGMLLKAQKERDIDMGSSFMVGDKISDIKAGRLAGCTTVGVRTGYGCNDGFNDAVPDILADDLYNAVEMILRRWK